MVKYFDALELALCLRVNALSRRAVVCSFFSAISRLGDYPAWVVFGLACLFQQGTNAPLFALHTTVTALAGIVAYKLLKDRLVRERPYVTHGEIVCGTAPLDRYSFPSGHTLHAVSFTILYGSYEPHLLILLVPFALLIASSRIILGLHYPSDVLVGGAVGAAIATSSLALFH